jgi:hypothetical protein
MPFNVRGGAMTSKNVKESFNRLGNMLVTGFQTVALFVIGATIVWSAAARP